MRSRARSRSRGADRVALKTLLRELADDGVLVRGGRRAVAVAGALPPVVLAEITGLDRDGEAIDGPPSGAAKASRR